VTSTRVQTELQVVQLGLLCRPLDYADLGVRRRHRVMPASSMKSA